MAIASGTALSGFAPSLLRSLGHSASIAYRKDEHVHR